MINVQDLYDSYLVQDLPKLFVELEKYTPVELRFLFINLIDLASIIANHHDAYVRSLNYPASNEE